MKFMKMAALALLLSVAAFAQAPTATGQYNPVTTAWWIETIIYGIFGAVVAIAILWHCLHGALGSHDGFGKIINVLVFAGIGFGALYIVTHMVSGTAAPI